MMDKSIVKCPQALNDANTHNRDQKRISRKNSLIGWAGHNGDAVYVLQKNKHVTFTET